MKTTLAQRSGLAFLAIVLLVVGKTIGHERVLLCDTPIRGVSIELRSRPILPDRYVVVRDDPSTGSELRQEIRGQDELRKLGIALAQPGDPPIDLSVEALRRGHCRAQ